MNTILMTKGIPASGKTTWTLNEMRKNPNKYKRVNKDLFREMIDAGLHDRNNEDFILKIRDYAVESALLKKHDVIVDDTNFSDKHFNAMCKIAKSIEDVLVQEKYFECSLKEALDRNSKRENKVPEHVIENMYVKHIKNKSIACRSEYFPPNNFENVKDDLKNVIVDMDGTLAMSNDRNIYDLSQVLNDTINDRIKNLVKIFHSNGFKIIIVSGREDICKQDTIDWLNINEIPFNDLYMRKLKDYRKDSIVKREIYENFIIPNFGKVSYAIDDRPQVCKMWRELGITVLQLNHLDF